MLIANIAMMFKKKKTSTMKPFKKASPWQDMKRHTKYNDPVRNYGSLSSFYQMIVNTSIHLPSCH